LGSIRTLHRSQCVDYPVEEVERRYVLNPVRFRRALSKAKAYARRGSFEYAFVLGIACHLFDLMELEPWCFYCAKPFSDSDFNGPNVHLEHFIPRSKSPLPDLFGRLPYFAHHQHRIVLACADCNSIKSNHSDEDFRHIVLDAEAFFRGRRYTHDRKEHLI